ncbi:unannotated protein [freshwater metagenome]|uniref:Unannotated protein n=1 Tax=freshwater metagenome TaxID=449393 RepID=A0A6J7GSX3_9ZZZZ
MDPARTTSNSGSTATGLKKCMPTTRSGGCRSAAISVIDSADVLVASTHCADTTASTSAKTCFFTDSSSNTASITRSASANADFSSDPLTRPFSRLSASGDSRPLPASFSSSPWTQPTPLSTRAWSTSVSTTGTCSLRRKRRASWEAISPAPTTPTLVTGRASALSGAPAGRLARFWVRSKA